MKSLLEMLYDGELLPGEQIIVKDARYKEACNTIADLIHDMQGRLSAADFERLEEVLSLRSEIGDMELSATFVHGFKLGAGLMMEMVDGRNGGLDAADPVSPSCRTLF